MELVKKKELLQIIKLFNCFQLILNFTSLIHFTKKFKHVNKSDEFFYSLREEFTLQSDEFYSLREEFTLQSDEFYSLREEFTLQSDEFYSLREEFTFQIRTNCASSALKNPRTGLLFLRLKKVATLVNCKCKCFLN